MSTRNLVTMLALAALTLPAFADLPDGQSGRTAPQAAATVTIPARACCPRLAPQPAQVATNSAELKALGHLAWVARANEPAFASGCRRRVPSETRVYASSAELKALAHLARPADPAAPRLAPACCNKGTCPMRRHS